MAKVYARIKSLIYILGVSFVLLEIIARIFGYFKAFDNIVYDDKIMYTGEPGKKFHGAWLNDIGCIGDPLTVPKQPGEVRIMLLGGSTSYFEHYVNTVRETVSNTNPDRIINVVSCGKPRYTTYNNLVNLRQNLVQYELDYIVLYAGINDCIYNTFYWINGLPDIGLIDWNAWDQSVFWKSFKYIIVDKLIRSDPEFSSGSIRSAEIFRENVQEVINIANDNDIKVVLSTFAVAWPPETDSLAVTISEMEPLMEHFWGNIPSTVYGVQKHNEIMQELARQNKFQLVKMDNAIPKTGDYFGDICHMKKPGLVILGNRIAVGIGKVSSNNK